MASIARASARRLPVGPRLRVIARGKPAGHRFASTSGNSPASTLNNALLRGILAGAGLSLAAVLISYRTGLITIAGESAVSPLGGSSKRKYATPDEVQKAIAELREALPGQGAVSTNPDALATYGSSPNSYHPESPHSVVVHVTSTEDVVKVVNIARKYRVPIVAYSGATSLEGHFSGVSFNTAFSIPSQEYLLLGKHWEYLSGHVCYGQNPSN